MEPTQGFLEARDFLFKNRTDYEAADRGFEWPRLERFNWGLDYFDVYALGHQRPALWIVDEAGGETKRGPREYREEDFPELKGG